MRDKERRIVYVEKKFFKSGGKEKKNETGN